MTYSSEVRLRDIPKSERAMNAAAAGALSLTALGSLLPTLTRISSVGPSTAVIAVFAVTFLVVGVANVVTLDRALREVSA